MSVKSSTKIATMAMAGALLLLSRALLISCQRTTPTPAPPPAPVSASTPAPVPAPASAPTTSSETVSVPDAYLEAAIRWALKQPQGSIYTSDLESITRLEATTSLISDLTGLGYCINLTELTLYSNKISDISPLGKLTNLQGLNLDGNQICDISPLSGLTNLQHLELNSNQISDISDLSGLTNLGWLGLYHNRINDIYSLVENSGFPPGVIDLGDNPLSVVSANIYIIQLWLRGSEVRGTGKTIFPTIILGTALLFVAMGMRRISNWGLKRRILQLALIIIVGGFAYYLALTVVLIAVALPLGIFASILVGSGIIVTIRSFRGWVWDLVALALIVLWAVYIFTMDFLQIYDDRMRAESIAIISASCLATAGYFFFLRRVRLAIAIIVYVVIRACGFALFALAMTGID